MNGVDGPTYRVEQTLSRKGFEQPGRGGVRLGCVAQGWIVMGRNEDDGALDAVLNQSLVKLNTGHSGETNIENKARSPRGETRLQE